MAACAALEYHIHTYFNAHDPVQVASAERVRASVVACVRQGTLRAVCHGVDATVLPGIGDDHVPAVNLKPVGPHPCGSFETWVPSDELDAALAVFKQAIAAEEQAAASALVLLVHPLTELELEDHTVRARWIGSKPLPLKLGVLRKRLSRVPAQYPGLKWGYSAPTVDAAD